MQLDVIVVDDIENIVWKESFDPYIYPVSAGIADCDLQMAFVVDVLFLFHFEKRFSAPNIVGYSVREIDRVVLHELAHLCGCGEKEAEAVEKVEGILIPVPPER